MQRTRRTELSEARKTPDTRQTWTGCGEGRGGRGKSLVEEI